MRGTFTTRKYADRAALEADRPTAVEVSHNAFVDVGLNLLWRILAGQVRNDEGGMSDHLGKARIIVGNGDKPVEPGDERLAGEDTAYAELDSDPVVAGGTITFVASFGEDVANFEWAERGVTSVQGVLIDRSVGDQGRKSPGTVWTVEAVLELA